MCNIEITIKLYCNQLIIRRKSRQIRHKDVSQIEKIGSKFLTRKKKKLTIKKRRQSIHFKLGRKKV